MTQLGQSGRRGLGRRRVAANLFPVLRERRRLPRAHGRASRPLLVGAVLLAVPGSPLYKKPTLGLDLQGGTRGDPQARFRSAASRSTRPRCRPRRTSSSSRVNKHRRRVPERGRPGLGRDRRPARGHQRSRRRPRRSSGRRASCSSSTSRRTSRRRRWAAPVSRRLCPRSTACSARSRRTRRRAIPRPYYLFGQDDQEERDDEGQGQEGTKQKTTTIHKLLARAEQ